MEGDMGYTRIWKGFLCVCVCARAHARVYVCVCQRVGGGKGRQTSESAFTPL